MSSTPTYWENANTWTSYGPSRAVTYNVKGRCFQPVQTQEVAHV